MPRMSYPHPSKKVKGISLVKALGKRYKSKLSTKGTKMRGITGIRGKL